MPGQKTCFVVMGFGEKTNHVTNQKLDLDKTYEYIIKPSVEACGVECVRADEIIHSGIIDTPMYQQLLDADVVVADLSTSNENAIYELGVRHALRPNTTIVIAEENFSFPFDLGHVLIRTYKHLGTGIDFGEVQRMRESLEAVIKETLEGCEDPDSPVYTFLPDLEQPQRNDGDEEEATEATADEEESGESLAYSTMVGKATRAMNEKDYDAAKDLFRQILEIKENDSFARQQLALATYKHEQPTAKDALLHARQIIEESLQPTTTNDPETLGLWGAIHKRLWELDGDRSDLDASIRAYERGFYLMRDYYNGINYAFMLDVRAGVETSADEATTDRTIAMRVRRDVIELVDHAEKTLPRDQDGKPADPSAAYWIAATRLEAQVGLGEVEHGEEDVAIEALDAPSVAMTDSTRAQLTKLRGLL